MGVVVIVRGYRWSSSRLLQNSESEENQSCHGVECKECHLVAVTLLHATLFVADQVAVAQWLVHLTVV